MEGRRPRNCTTCIALDNYEKELIEVRNQQLQNELHRTLAILKQTKHKLAATDKELRRKTEELEERDHLIMLTNINIHQLSQRLSDQFL